MNLVECGDGEYKLTLENSNLSVSWNIRVENGACVDWVEENYNNWPFEKRLEKL